MIQLNLKKSSSKEGVKKDLNLEGDSKKKIIIAASVLMGIGIGLAVYFMFFSGSDSSDKLPPVSDGSSMEAGVPAMPGASSPQVENEGEAKSWKEQVSGVTVGGLFIPSKLNEKAMDFLKGLEGKGDLPVIVEDNILGKPNLFSK